MLVASFKLIFKYVEIALLAQLQVGPLLLRNKSSFSIRPLHSCIFFSPCSEVKHLHYTIASLTRTSAGSKESMLSFNLDAAQEHRALSLLSTDSWAPANIPLDQQSIHVNLANTTQPPMHGVPQGLPLASPEYWQSQRPTDSRLMHTFSANENTHFQEFQLFKAPYENGLYNNLLN